MNARRRLATSLIQRAARRLDSRYLELFHQANYIELARRTPWLDDIPLASASGGTASFALLYTLLAALDRHRPASALEAGAGCSTRLLTQYGAAYDVATVHVDDDEGWLTRSIAGAPGATAMLSGLATFAVAGRSVRWYARRPAGPFELVIVDGPASWQRERRYSRLGFATWVPDVLADEFVVILDDTSRRGEQELARLLKARLASRSPAAQAREIVGANSLTVLATPRFESLLYL